MSTKTRDDIVETLREEFAGIEEKVMTTSLADLIRSGSEHTTQEYGWGAGENACALSAAAYAGVALGVIDDKR